MIPDLLQSLLADQPMQLRHPQAVRPWQHVLESLHGYLLLAQGCMGIVHATRVAGISGRMPTTPKAWNGWLRVCAKNGGSRRLTRLTSELLFTRRRTSDSTARKRGKSWAGVRTGRSSRHWIASWSGQEPTSNKPTCGKSVLRTSINTERRGLHESRYLGWRIRNADRRRIAA